jgi:hypothetical protein
MSLWASVLLFLKVWLAAAAALIGGLLAVNLVTDFLAQLRDPVPRPFFLLYQRTLARLVAKRPTQQLSLFGRGVLLDWDLRFVAAGRSLGTIVDVDAAGQQIKVALVRPIAVLPVPDACDAPPQVVSFCPKDGEAAYYCHRQVRGTLRPAVAGGYLSASLIVYPPSVEVTKPGRPPDIQGR